MYHMYNSHRIEPHYVNNRHMTNKSPHGIYNIHTDIYNIHMICTIATCYIQVTWHLIDTIVTFIFTTATSMCGSPMHSNNMSNSGVLGQSPPVRMSPACKLSIRHHKKYLVSHSFFWKKWVGRADFIFICQISMKESNSTIKCPNICVPGIRCW